MPVSRVADDPGDDIDDDSHDEQEVACQDGHQIGHPDPGAQVPIITTRRPGRCHEPEMPSEICLH